MKAWVERALSWVIAYEYKRSRYKQQREQIKKAPITKRHKEFLLECLRRGEFLVHTDSREIAKESGPGIGDGWEGISSADIYLSLSFRWDFFSIRRIIRKMLSFWKCRPKLRYWASYLFRDGFTKNGFARSWSNVRHLYKEWWEWRRPEIKTYAPWAWVVNSLDVYRMDLAQEFSKSRRHTTAEHDRLEKLRKLITKDELIAYTEKIVKEKRLPGPGVGLWHDVEEPHVFTIDETDPLFAYDMKDGWSKKRIMEITRYWIQRFTGADVTVSWYDPYEKDRHEDME